MYEMGAKRARCAHPMSCCLLAGWSLARQCRSLICAREVHPFRPPAAHGKPQWALVRKSAIAVLAEYMENGCGFHPIREVFASGKRDKTIACARSAPRHKLRSDTRSISVFLQHVKLNLQWTYTCACSTLTSAPPGVEHVHQHDFVLHTRVIPLSTCDIAQPLTQLGNIQNLC